VEDVFGNRGRSDNVVVNQGRNVAQVGEQVATQQRLRGSSYSSQASHACGTCGVSRCRTRLPRQVEHFAVDHCPRRPVGFQYADMARKVVGVGSVGTRCWIILMLGRDESDPLFLQVKEAQTSVLSRFVGASKYTNQGQRVVAGQRLVQASSDIFLGWQQSEVGLDGQ
jgi:hypothetical protein